MDLWRDILCRLAHMRFQQLFERKMHKEQAVSRLALLDKSDTDLPVLSGTVSPVRNLFWQIHCLVFPSVLGPSAVQSQNESSRSGPAFKTFLATPGSTVRATMPFVNAGSRRPADLLGHDELPHSQWCGTSSDREYPRNIFGPGGPEPLLGQALRSSQGTTPAGRRSDGLRDADKVSPGRLPPALSGAMPSSASLREFSSFPSSAIRDQNCLWLAGFAVRVFTGWSG